jgi:hypothetical protein
MTCGDYDLQAVWTFGIDIVIQDMKQLKQILSNINFLKIKVNSNTNKISTASRLIDHKQKLISSKTGNSRPI